MGGTKESADLTLQPYVSYRFRVTAINAIGTSDHSAPSELHSTPAEGQISTSASSLKTNTLRNFLNTVFTNAYAL